MQPDNRETGSSLQPQTPTPAAPTDNPSIHKTVLQPLSSEDDIRREAESHVPPTHPPVPQQPATNEGAPVGSTDLNVNAQHPPVVIPPLPGSAVETSSPKHKSPWLKRIVITLLLLATIVGGVIAWALFTASSYSVKESDLIEERAEATTYLRPKQWVAHNNGFGDGRSAGGKSSSMIVVKVSPSEPRLINASPELLALARQQTESSLTDERVREMLMPERDNACTSVPEIKRSSDVSSVDGMSGLYLIDALCERKDGRFTIKIRVYLGNADGRLRVVMVGAGESIWKLNSATYDQMLTSVKVTP